jgi:AcrR family transcriptional regulator
MATKETQSLILDTAIELFNQFGTAKVSTNRIASACHLSKGNVHYHFKNKESIIHSIYDRFSAEVRTEWNDETDAPTTKDMELMFSRQLHQLWNYRFFYREMVPILATDEHLKFKFHIDRAQRIEKVSDFFKALRTHGLLKADTNDSALNSLVLIGWVLTDNWINFIEAGQAKNCDDTKLAQEYFHTGYQLIIDLFRPSLTELALQELSN